MKMRKYTVENLLEQYKNPDVLKKTIDQINKDLYVYGEVVDLDVNSANAYSHLLDLVSLIVKRMLEQNSEQFFALLYRIDVSENSVNKVLSTEGDQVKQLSSILIEREAIKVLTRANFRP